jgi:hypothetical protein
MKVISEIEVERILSMVENELRNDPLYATPEKVPRVTTKEIADYAIEQIERIRRNIKTKTRNED